MFIGLLLLGSVIGAASGMTAFILGSSVWMAALIYSGIGALSVLAGAIVLISRPKLSSQTETSTSHELASPQRG